MLLRCLIFLFACTPALADIELNQSVSAVSANVLPTPAVGNLQFEHHYFDAGTAVEGALVTHIYTFKNSGTAPLKIVAIKTSCGCTTTNAALKTYAAGEAGELQVTVDTQGKKGLTVKTVTLQLENASKPSVDLTMLIRLTPPPHPPLGEPRNINTEAACKSCHLESGVGLMDKYLFGRVCSQCHGSKGKGASARTFIDAAWQQSLDDEMLAFWIRNGAPALGMPSFVEGVTPPLSEEQVGSLVKYIRGMLPK